MAACGSTAAFFSVCTRMRTLTKAPGHSAWSLFSNTAFTFTVPEDASTALSTNCSLPTSSVARSGNAAVTRPSPSRSARSASPTLRCGTLKPTSTGSSWVIVTSGVVLACTELPANTLTAPARPAPGAVMRP